MLTPFGEQAIKQFVTEAVNESLKLEIALNGLRTEKTVVVLHYAPVAATVMGEPLEIYPFLGSSRLAETSTTSTSTSYFTDMRITEPTKARRRKGRPFSTAAYSLTNRINPEHPYALIEV